MSTAKPAAKETKSQEARAREARMILVQLQDLGVPERALEAMRATLDDFVGGVGATQTWTLRDEGVKVTLLLSTQPHVVSYARVRRARV